MNTLIQYYNIILFTLCLIIIYKGLTLYKIYIALLSGICFSAIALYAGMLFSFSEIAVKMIVITGFITGILISWFIYRIYIYINAFVIGYFLFLLLLLTSGINYKICIIAASAGALGITWLTYKFFDTFLIINISMSATFIIFLLVVPGIFDEIYALADLSLTDTVFHNNELQINFFQAMLQIIKAHLINLIMVIIIYVGFSLFIQKYYNTSGDKKHNIYNKVFQTLCYYFGIVAVIIYFFEQVFRISPRIFFGFSLHTWPLLIFILFHVLKYITLKFGFHKRNNLYWILLIVIAVILVPVINWIIDFPFYLRLISSIDPAGNVTYISLSESIRNWLNFPVFFYYNITDLAYYFDDQSTFQIYMYKAIQFVFFILILPTGFILSFKRNLKK